MKIDFQSPVKREESISQKKNIITRDSSSGRRKTKVLSSCNNILQTECVSKMANIRIRHSSNSQSDRKSSQALED